MTEFPYAAPAPLLEALEQSRHVVLASHENPDADGIGSLLALGLALQERGCTVWRLENGPVPEPLTRLPGFDRIEVWSASAGSACDLAVLFDCHRRARLGDAAAVIASAPMTAAIDHHPLDPRGSDVDCAWLVEDAPATAMMVQALLGGWPDVVLDATKASLLYAGLLTDTGGFRHANTTHAALRAASELVRAGADPSALAEMLLHRRRPQVVHLTGEVLRSVRYHLGGRLALMVVDRELLGRTGARLDETEHLASLLTGIDGVVVGALMREVEPGAWRVSLRARREGRVDEIARGFGGDGHRRTAAYTAQGRSDEVEAALAHAAVAVLDHAEEGGSG